MSESPPYQVMITALHTNLLELNLFLKAFGQSFASYLDLTGGTPTEPLELPPNYMDAVAWLKETARLTDELQAARGRDGGGGTAVNQAVKARWNHVFFKRPIDAEKFRSRLGALVDERYSLMLAAKSHRDYDAVGLFHAPGSHVGCQVDLACKGVEPALPVIKDM